MPDFIETLEWRGFIAQSTDPAELREHFATGSRVLYAGFDPTASSLHVGHLVPVMALAHAQRCGHRPIALVGGGTGLIGDPSGKASERPLLSKEDVERNADSIRGQLSKFMDFAGAQGATLLNNLDWLQPLGLLDFLRDVGKHFSLNTLIGRESVRRRLEDREQGISYTEFSYGLLQAYDFLHLFRAHGCTAQLGGNDQWGNIVSGIDLIGRACHEKAYAITLPLLLTSAGVKFGKTEAGAIWLDPNLTSPYQMYQFWLNTADADVVRFLKLFTFLDRERIEEFARATVKRPETREAQRALAASFTALVHGEATVRSVEDVSRILFGATDVDVTREMLEHLSREMPTSHIDAAELNMPLADLLASTGLAESKGAARKLIQSGGAYVNNRRRNDVAARVTEADLLCGTSVLLRSGKKNYHLAAFRHG